MTDHKERQTRKITENRRAYHDYHILKRLEVGIVLKGTEVKSIRDGHFSLGEAYVVVRDGELFLVGAHISPYKEGNRFNPDPIRDRKLLAHRHEIESLATAVQQKGMTLVPLKAYFSRGRVKLEIGLARGKKQYDKREAIRERDSDREMRRQVKKFFR
ncbi:MAG: SsrA-binding protein SmpB [Saccharofermentanales bacterium]|jgi:SsrA-binding protein